MAKTPAPVVFTETDFDRDEYPDTLKLWVGRAEGETWSYDLWLNPDGMFGICLLDDGGDPLNDCMGAYETYDEAVAAANEFRDSVWGDE